jgi:hypothetical protein
MSSTGKLTDIYKLTIEAYGQIEVIHAIRQEDSPHHRVHGVVDQAHHDGELILKTLDDMRAKSLAVLA